ncbi:MAG: cell division protein FtsL [Gammaproteobacteria bacterium]|nr:cell division protein FtsL [Gammaproteobacteria bacterium]
MQSMPVFLLLFLILVSAYSVVTVRHENRLAFVRLQGLEEKRSHLQSEWGRLMLERATWSTQHNLAEDAEKRLGMSPPPYNRVFTVDRG